MGDFDRGTSNRGIGTPQGIKKKNAAKALAKRILNDHEIELMTKVYQDFFAFHDLITQEFSHLERETKIKSSGLIRIKGKESIKVEQIFDFFFLNKNLRIATQALNQIKSYLQSYSLSMISKEYTFLINQAMLSPEVNLSYQLLIRSLSKAEQIKGIKDTRQVIKRENEEIERRKNAPKWDFAVIANPKLPVESLIEVGEKSGPFQIDRIDSKHQIIYTSNVNTGETATFSYENWRIHRALAGVANAPWIRMLRKSVTANFFYGIIEGFAGGIKDILLSTIYITETLNGIKQALSDLGATGEAIWKALEDWAMKFDQGGSAQKARMIGRIIGGILFELVGTKGLGKVAKGRSLGKLGQAKKLQAALESKDVGKIKKILDEGTPSQRIVPETKGGGKRVDFPEKIDNKVKKGKKNKEPSDLDAEIEQALVIEQDLNLMHLARSGNKTRRIILGLFDTIGPQEIMKVLNISKAQRRYIKIFLLKKFDTLLINAWNKGGTKLLRKRKKFVGDIHKKINNIATPDQASKKLKSIINDLKTNRKNLHNRKKATKSYKGLIKELKRLKKQIDSGQVKDINAIKTTATSKLKRYARKDVFDPWRNNFWKKVNESPKLRSRFEKAGFNVNKGGSGAPKWNIDKSALIEVINEKLAKNNSYKRNLEKLGIEVPLDVNGSYDKLLEIETQMRLTIEHVDDAVKNPSRIVDPTNFTINLARENSVFFNIIKQKIPAILANR